MSDEKPFRFRFFLPDARLLSEREIENLPENRRQYAAAVGKEGLWLELKCPDGSCMDAQGRITLPIEKSNRSEDEGLFLDLFCPGDSCEVVQSTDLP